MKRLLLILLFLSIFMMTGCETKDDSKKDLDTIVNENKTENEVRDLTEIEISELIALIDDLIYLDYYNKDFKVEELSNQEVLRASISIFRTGYPNADLTLTELKVIAKKFFNYDLKEENVKCENHIVVENSSDYILLYDATTDTFVPNDSHIAHEEGGFTTEVYNRYSNGKVKDKSYTISVYKLFSDLSSSESVDTKSYYATYENAVNKVNPLLVSTYDYSTNDWNVEPKEQLDTLNINVLKIYTYEFEMIDNRFVLKSYSVAK